MIPLRPLPLAAALLLIGCGSAPDQFGEGFGSGWQAGGVDVVWERDVGELGRNFSVSEAGGRLCVANAAGDLLFIDPSSGEVERTVRLGGRITASSACSQSRVAVVSEDASLIGYDTASGGERWRQPLSGKLLGAPFYAGGDSLLLFHADGLVRSVSMETGIRLWAVELDSVPFRLDGAFLPHKVGSNVLFGMPDGTLYMLDYENGVLRLNYRLREPAAAGSTSVLSNIGGAAADGETFCASAFLGSTTCFALSSGVILWKASQSTGGRPAIGAGSLFMVDTSGDLVALDMGDGSERWRMPASSSNRTAAVLYSGGAVLVDNGFSGISLHDPGDGSLMGGLADPGEIVSLVGRGGDGEVLIASSAGRIASLRLR